MEATKPSSNGGGLDLSSLMGGGLPSVFTDDDEFAGVDDYAEEYTDKNGNHVHKEVHKGDGWTSVSYSSDGGGAMGGGDPFGDTFGGDIIGDMIA